MTNNIKPAANAETPIDTIDGIAAENFEIEDIFDLDLNAATNDYLCASCCGSSSS